MTGTFLKHIFCYKMFNQMFNSSVFCNQYCSLSLFYSKILSRNVNIDFFLFVFMVITVFVVEMVVVIDDIKVSML